MEQVENKFEEYKREAFKLRFQYYNVYEGKEDKWHERYKENIVYDIVVEGFQFDFKQIGVEMPKIINKYFDK